MGIVIIRSIARRSIARPLRWVGRSARWGRLLVLVGLAVLALSCTNDVELQSGCSPIGSTQACVCDEGRVGERVCLEDQVYGDCTCLEPETGGPDLGEDSPADVDEVGDVLASDGSEDTVADADAPDAPNDGTSDEADVSDHPSDAAEDRADGPDEGPSPICTEGAHRCVSSSFHQREVCSSGAWSPETCGTNWCADGDCLEPCVAAQALGTNLGCAFVAVELEQAEWGECSGPADCFSFAGTTCVERSDASSWCEPSPRSAALGLLLVNPDPVAAITVTGTSALLDQQVFMEAVDPQGVELVTVGGHDLEGSAIGPARIDVSSTGPAAIIQLGPAEAGLFSADASLLYPSHLADRDYLVVVAPAAPASPRSAGLTVIPVGGAAAVTVRPTVQISSGDGVPVLFPGLPSSPIDVAANEVLHLVASSTEDNLSGTRITSTGDVLVLVDAPFSATGGVCCGDHLEEQLPPLSFFDSAVIAPAAPPRAGETTTWQVVSAEDNNIIALSDGESLDLDQFQTDQVSDGSSLSVSAAGTVLMGQILAGSSADAIPIHEACTGLGLGDPALTVITPPSTWLTYYPIAVAPGYLESYVTVVAPVGADIRLDSEAIAPETFANIGDSGYVVAHLEVDSPGAAAFHALIGDQPFAAVVTGYGCAVSYAYPAGVRRPPE